VSDSHYRSPTSVTASAEQHDSSAARRIFITVSLKTNRHRGDLVLLHHQALDCVFKGKPDSKLRSLSFTAAANFYPASMQLNQVTGY
jgi:hypothetical protein